MCKKQHRLLVRPTAYAEMKSKVISLLLNLVSFDNSGARVCFGIGHRDILPVLGIPSVLNILCLAHNIIV